jgi:serine protease Do
MKFIKSLKTISTSICLCVGLSHATSNEISPGMPSLSPTLKQIMPAIVNIAVQGSAPGQIILPPDQPNQQMPDPSFVPPPRKFQGLGSGVIVDPAHGIVVTNSHVIRNAELITITLHDGRHLTAKKIGEDPATDIAVLQIKAERLQSLPVGDSDKVEVGDFVVAIGNPFGLNSFGNSQSATFGIVSAMKRSELNMEGIENFIQTDAAINPGNSGGALVNTKGQLIGINTGILSLSGGNIGIGFAIPINMVKDITQQILQYGSVERGVMGIFVQHLTPELGIAMGYAPSQKGALIAQVNQNSTAQQAGLLTGDIITKINDTVITEATQVKTTVSLLRAGSQAKINILRNGQAKEITVLVTDFKKHEQQLQASNPFLYGLALRNFEQDMPPNGLIKGVQVVGALESSNGWRAGLRPGDIIIAANHKPTEKIENLQNVAKSEQKKLLLQVLRGDGALFILVE